MLTPQNLSLNRLALVLLPCPAQEEDPSLIPPLACLSSLEFLAVPIDGDEEDDEDDLEEDEDHIDEQEEEEDEDDFDDEDDDEDEKIIEEEDGEEDEDDDEEEDEDEDDPDSGTFVLQRSRYIPRTLLSSSALRPPSHTSRPSL
jgi:hypothetical protein